MAGLTRARHSKAAATTGSTRPQNKTGKLHPLTVSASLRRLVVRACDSFRLLCGSQRELQARARDPDCERYIGRVEILRNTTENKPRAH